MDKGVEYQAYVSGCLDSLHNYAVLLARPPEDCEDLLQESLIRGFRGFDSFDRGLPFKAWMFGIIRNTYIDRPGLALPGEPDDQVARGKAVYERRCVGCHGAKGDGNGPAATFLDPRPRNFTIGAFKFRTTPSGSLPTDGDLYRTLARGVRWTAMPTWHELPEKDRIAVIAFIKTFSSRWKEEKPEPPIVIGDPPEPAPELLVRGKELYTKAKCFQCHGDGGKGDGPSADELEDDLKFKIRPADFTKGQFKGGGDVRDIYRTMTTGLDGAPMPSFVDSMKDDERWAISYYVLSFSAFNDPLTGKKLALDPATRARLNDPDERVFRHPRLALDATAPPAVAGKPKELVRFYKGLMGEGR